MRKLLILIGAAAVAAYVAASDFATAADTVIPLENHQTKTVKECKPEP